jgi:hypothetical protein
MKKTALFLALATGIAVNAAALAEGFNQRGEAFSTGVQPGSAASSREVAVTPNGFNQRGVDFIAQAPASSKTSPTRVYITASGFNDRTFEHMF